MVALAQRFQRLAAEIERRRGPERIDRIGQQQHLDAAGLRGFKLWIRLQPLEAVAGEIIDLGLVRLEILDILLQRALLAVVVVKRDSASNFSRRSKSSQMPSLMTGPNASQILANASGPFRRGFRVRQ
jgi:hypothetical protein